MINALSCSQCGTFDFKFKSHAFGRNNELLGEWPIYYVGNPMDPHLATHYFCGPECSNEWYKENRDAQEGTDE